MAYLMRSVFLFCATICVVFGNKHDQYDGHTLYEVFVKNAHETTFVNELENQMLVDIFSYAQPSRAGHILVSKELKAQFEAELNAEGIEYKVEVPNMKEELELEDKLLAQAASRSKSSSPRSKLGIDFEEIHRYQVVNDYLDRLAASYPDTVTVGTAGQSFEGRDIKYLKISTTNFQDTRKPVVFIMSLLHAREWVTLPASLYAIEKLVIDVQEEDLLNTIDWIIVPVANPDGYEFSHTNTRFWRKNRRNGLMVGDFCMGVDLNRNFDAFWGTASSNNVCSDTFHGRHAFSEPETSTIRDLLAEHSPRVGLFIDLHSFGSIILYGFGNGQLPDNVLAINLNAVYQAQAIDKVKWESKPNYIVGNVFNILYAASGGSSDFVQLSGVPFSYTYELPSWRGVTGHLNGFLVDPEFIEQAGMETWEGIKTGARYMRDRYW